MDLNDKIRNPWHGCHKCSEGCQNCYAYFLDKRYGRDTNELLKNKSDFTLPIKKDRAGNRKLASGSFVRVCMASDFFIEEADPWRGEAWDMIRRRPDVTFSLLTKRAERIRDCLPAGWGEGWDNASFSVSCENQARLEQRMPYLLDLPAKHRRVSLKPFIGEIDLADCLATGKIETVLAGGENYLGSRPLHNPLCRKGSGIFFFRFMSSSFFLCWGILPRLLEDLLDGITGKSLHRDVCSWRAYPICRFLPARRTTLNPIPQAVAT